MKDFLFEQQTSHELNRQKIAQQVDEFLKSGGKIEVVDTAHHDSKMIAQGWRPPVGGFEV